MSQELKNQKELLLRLLADTARHFKDIAETDEELDQYKHGLEVLQKLTIDGAYKAVKRGQVFIGVPHYGPVEWEMAIAVWHTATKAQEFDLTARSASSSLLANCFNKLLCACINEKRWEYFVIIHSDIIPQVEAWADFLVHEANSLPDCWCLHGVAPIKNVSGLTSTAVGNSLDEWDIPRRITERELARLPETFNCADYIREVVTPIPPNPCLLPNTGCTIMRCDYALRKFAIDRAFVIKDKIYNVDGQFSPWVIPEDWGLGYWCAQNNIRPYGTRKLNLKHVGSIEYLTGEWGQWNHDMQYIDQQKFMALQKEKERDLSLPILE